MGCTTQLRNVVVAAVTGVASLAMLATPAFAVEMFTYFGDGSHIGLPSLEVPIEAYPGIPLRSDRLRARRAGTAPPRGTIGYFRGRSRGITIRVPVQQQMPPAAGIPGQPMPEPVPTPLDDEAAAAKPRSETPVAKEAAAAPAVTKTADDAPVARGANLDFGGLRELSAFDPITR